MAEKQLKVFRAQSAKNPPPRPITGVPYAYGNSSKGFKIAKKPKINNLIEERPYSGEARPKQQIQQETDFFRNNMEVFDKERLFENLLQAKSSINQLIQENYQLKTQNLQQEKQIQKYERIIEDFQNNGDMKKFQMKLGVETSLFLQMKRQIKEQQSDIKEREQILENLKKNAKVCKFQELDTERQEIYQELYRLRQIITEKELQFQKQQEDISKFINSNQYQSDLVQKNESLLSDNQELVQIVKLYEDRNQQLEQQINQLNKQLNKLNREYQSALQRLQLFKKKGQGVMVNQEQIEKEIEEKTKLNYLVEEQRDRIQQLEQQIKKHQLENRKQLDLKSRQTRDNQKIEEKQQIASKEQIQQLEQIQRESQQEFKKKKDEDQTKVICITDEQSQNQIQSKDSHLKQQSSQEFKKSSQDNLYKDDFEQVDDEKIVEEDPELEDAVGKIQKAYKLKQQKREGQKILEEKKQQMMQEQEFKRKQQQQEEQRKQQEIEEQRKQQEIEEQKRIKEQERLRKIKEYEEERIKIQKQKDEEERIRKEKLQQEEEERKKREQEELLKKQKEQEEQLRKQKEEQERLELEEQALKIQKAYRYKQRKEEGRQILEDKKYEKEQREQEKLEMERKIKEEQDEVAMKIQKAYKQKQQKEQGKQILEAKRQEREEELKKKKLEQEYQQQEKKNDEEDYYLEQNEFEEVNDQKQQEEKDKKEIEEEEISEENKEEQDQLEQKLFNSVGLADQSIHKEDISDADEKF